MAGKAGDTSATYPRRPKQRALRAQTSSIQTHIWSTTRTEFLPSTRHGPDTTEHTGRLRCATAEVPETDGAQVVRNPGLCRPLPLLCIPLRSCTQYGVTGNEALRLGPRILPGGLCSCGMLHARVDSVNWRKLRSPASSGRCRLELSTPYAR
jgi:hypothetical protein